MIIDKIKFSLSNTGECWVGAECTPEPGESPDEAFAAMQTKIKEWHGTKNTISEPPPYGPTPTINRATERLLVLIENSKTVQQLKEYYYNAQSADVMSAYNEKLAQLERSERAMGLK